MKFEIAKKEKPKIKDSVQDYLDAKVAQSNVRDKVEAGRGLQWAEDKKNDDANGWVQAEVETTHGSVGTKYTDDATKANGWLVARWHQSIQDNNPLLSKVLERLMLERQAADRLGGTVRPEDLKMQLVIPPKELNPAYNNMPKREPSQLDNR